MRPQHRPNTLTLVTISTPAVDRRTGFQGAVAVACPAVTSSHSCHAVLCSRGRKTRSLATTVSINCTSVSPRAGYKRPRRPYLSAVDIWVIYVAGISLIFQALGVVFRCGGRPVQGSGLRWGMRLPCRRLSSCLQMRCRPLSLD